MRLRRQDKEVKAQQVDSDSRLLAEMNRQLKTGHNSAAVVYGFMLSAKLS